MKLASSQLLGQKIQAKIQRREVRASRTVLVTARKNENALVPGVSRGVFYSSALLGALATVSPALAESTLPIDDTAVDGAVSSVVSAVQQAAGYVKQGLGSVNVFAGYLKDTYEKVAPVVKDAADVATPYVQQGVGIAKDAAEPVLKAAQPTLEAGIAEADKFLISSGLNTRVLVDATKSTVSQASDAITTAKPAVESTFSTLASTDPGTLAQIALGAIVLYYVAPPVLGGIFGSFRGYAGDLSPAAALDAVENGDAIIVDIRTQREKEASGVPDLPNSNKLIELSFAAIEDRKIRGQLRNPDAIEAEVTALQIAALKKVSKGKTLILLDRNGSVAKTIAKSLANKGFGRVYVLSGGFDGRGGWSASKLQAKLSSTVYAAEVVGPSFGSTRTKQGTLKAPRFIPGSKQKSLPGGR